MKSARQLNKKELLRALTKAGYAPKRTNGSHQIWSNGKQTVSVPIVHLRNIIAQKIVHSYGLQGFL